MSGKEGPLNACIEAFAAWRRMFEVVELRGYLRDAGLLTGAASALDTRLRRLANAGRLTHLRRRCYGAPDLTGLELRRAVISKLCRVCGVWKLFDELDENGVRHTTCRACVASRPVVTEGSRRCARCRVERPLSSYYVVRQRADGRCLVCAVCKRIDQKRYRTPALGGRRRGPRPAAPCAAKG